MKKLMVIAAVALCAIGANAATVDWNFGEVYQNAKAHADLSTYTAYLFTESAWSEVTALATSGAIKDTDFTGYLDSKGISVATAATMGTYNIGSSKRSVTSSGLKATDNYYIVIADTATDGSSIWAKQFTGIQSYDEGAAIVTPTDPAAWSIAKMTTSAYLKDSNKAYTMSSVPEPTSGFLLLLGMAGLALRRRRA